MSAASNSIYSYQLGGSLGFNHPTYVVRQADSDLYNALKHGEFCYVLNSRQTGKSSLRVQTMYRLLAEGIACAEIDLTGIGSQSVTAEQWYGGIIQELVSSFELKLNRRTWWRDRDDLSPVQRFKEFIEKVLLAEVSQNIVIFVDEIDSVLRLNFKDDFFAVIRACYNKRADKPEYRRLTFALLGVATPSDLIRDKNRTPFNIGRAIELNGFKLQEVQPLAKGLLEKASNPLSVLREVLTWTDGQPLLTQKLCYLVKTSPTPIPTRDEAKWIENLVRLQVISNWEATDEQEHLKTIRERLLRNEQRTVRLLRLYQQILLSGEVAADDSPEQMELQLSGLVVKQQGSLRVYNRIYESVFNLFWVDKALSDLRPYAEALEAWVATNYQDESWLLQGQALQRTLAWAAGKSLSDLDHQFLTASHKLEAQMALEAEKLERLEAQIDLEIERKEKQILTEAYAEAQQILNKAQKKAKRIIRRGLVVLTITSVAALSFGGLAYWQGHKAQIIQIQALNEFSEALRLSHQQLEALMASVKAGQQLRQTIWVPGTDQGNTVRALEQAVSDTQERNRLEGHSAGVISVSFSPDGQTLASASSDKTVKLWRRDGHLLRTLTGHSAEVYGVSFSPDSQTLASASVDQTIKLWRSSDGHLLRTLTGHSAEVISLSFSPDGETIASTSADKTVKLWRRSDGHLLRTLTGHNDWVIGVSFSPDGQTIASASRDRTIKLWRSSDGALLKTITGHSDEVGSVSFSPDGQTLASASSDKTVKLWRRSDGHLLRTLQGHSAGVWAVSFSPNGQTLASAGADKTVKLWRSSDGTELQTFQGHNDFVNSVSFSPDGQTLASASLDKTVKLWFPSQEDGILQHSAEVYGVSFSPNGQTLASASKDTTIKLWKLDGTLLQTLTGHKAGVYSVSFSPDGQTIASASLDKTVRLWRSRDGHLLRTLSGHSAGVWSVKFSPDGQTIASASLDKTVKLWRSRDGALLKTLTGHSATVWGVSFSPNGQILASASADKTVKLWRSRDGALLKTLQGHSAGVWGVSFSPNGQILASAGADKTVKLWRSRDGALLKTIQGHSAGVWGASFSPNGQILASASEDTTIKLWTLEGKLLKTLTGHRVGVSSVSFSPHGQILASASLDRSAKLWHLDGRELQTSQLDELLVRACNWLQDYLKTNPTLSQQDRQLCSGSGRVGSSAMRPTVKTQW